MLLLAFALGYLIHELTEKNTNQEEAQPITTFIYPLPKTMTPRVNSKPYTNPYLANGVIVVVNSGRGYLGF